MSRAGTTTGHDWHAPLPERLVHAEMHVSVTDDRLPTMESQHIWRLLKECGLLLDDVTVAHVNRWLADMKKVEKEQEGHEQGFAEDVHRHDVPCSFLQYIEVHHSGLLFYVECCCAYVPC